MPDQSGIQMVDLCPAAKWSGIQTELKKPFLKFFNKNFCLFFPYKYLTCCFFQAWEVDTCRGHYNNVSCVIFHPRQDLVSLKLPSHVIIKDVIHLTRQINSLLTSSPYVQQAFVMLRRLERCSKFKSKHELVLLFRILFKTDTSGLEQLCKCVE